MIISAFVAALEVLAAIVTAVLVDVTWRLTAVEARSVARGGRTCGPVGKARTIEAIAARIAVLQGEEAKTTPAEGGALNVGGDGALEGVHVDVATCLGSEDGVVSDLNMGDAIGKDTA